MTELALLGTLALRTGYVLEWDTKAMRVTNATDLYQCIDPPHRAPWKLYSKSPLAGRSRASPNAAN